MNNENTISQIKSNHSKTTLFLGIFLVLLIIGGVIFIIFRVRRAPAGPAPAGPPPAGPPAPEPNPPSGPKPSPVPTSLPPIIIGTGTNEVKIEDGKYYQFIGIPGSGGTAGLYTAYLAHDDSGTNNGVHWCLTGNGYDSTTGTCHGFMNATYNTIWQVKICPNNQFSLKAINYTADTNMLQCETGLDGCQLNAATPCQANTQANGTQLFTIAKSQASDTQNQLACSITAVFTDDASHQNQIGNDGSNMIKLFAEETCQNCSFLVEQWTGAVPTQS